MVVRFDHRSLFVPYLALGFWLFVADVCHGLLLAFYVLYVLRMLSLLLSPASGTVVVRVQSVAGVVSV